VLPGADVALAASAGAFGSFLHQGQICMSTGRHLVHESLHDAYVAALAEKADHLPVGDPASGQVALGPIIDTAQLQHIDRLVRETVLAGARLAAGGSFEGLFYRPTVLADVTPTMAAYTEEVFGPVAPVVAFGSITEVIALASDTDYGLSLGILGDALGHRPHQRADRRRRSQHSVWGRRGFGDRFPFRRRRGQHRGVHRDAMAHRPQPDCALPVLEPTGRTARDGGHVRC